MNPARKTIAGKIGRGLLGKLEFEYSCGRGYIFGETYMHGVLMELIASNIDHNTHIVQPGYADPALQSGAGGRHRELDFAAHCRTPGSGPHNGSMVLAAEAKWAGSSHATSKNVLLDACRLALVSESNQEATCLMVVAGATTKINQLFAPSQKPGTWPHRLLGGQAERKFYTEEVAGKTGRNDLRDNRIQEFLESSLPRLPRPFRIAPLGPHIGSKWSVRMWGVTGCP